MSKERQTGFSVQKKYVIAGAVLAASIAVGTRPVKSEDPYIYTPYPKEDFTLVLPKENRIKTEYPEQQIKVSEKIKNPKKTESTQDKLNAIISSLKDKPQILDGIPNNVLVEDLKMYYPIIEPVAKKYGLPWEIMMVTIEQESHASRSKNAFSSNNYPIYGIAQLNLSIWNKEYRKNASKGFESLSKLPQRHSDDWEQIATAYKLIYNNYKHYKDDGLSSRNSLLNSLTIYIGDKGLAQWRLENILRLEDIS